MKADNKKPARKKKGFKKPINLVAPRAEYKLKDGTMIPVHKMTEEQLQDATHHLTSVIEKRSQELEYLTTLLRYCAIEISSRNHTDTVVEDARAVPGLVYSTE